MKSVFKDANSLNKNEIDQIYSIHKHVYFDKQIGMVKNNWVNNLKKKYHNLFNKHVQIYFEDNGESICGYNIFLEPAFINGNQWSKIIEGGALSNVSENNSNIFLRMYKDLLNWCKNLNFIGETSVDFKGVTNLLIKSGFIPRKDINTIEEILAFFLNSHGFVLQAMAEGCVVCRDTALKANYIANVLIYPNKERL